jgi:N-acetylglucosamine malate deacetylase 2
MKGVPDMSRQLVASRIELELPHYATELPRWRSLLAVGAHPDDESFGLGAILAAFAAYGTSLAVLSFTRGEASTLGAGERDLVTTRADELREAGRILRVTSLEVLQYRDGMLASHAVGGLVEDVRRMACEVKADGLLVFDNGGVTGHPDHQRATEAAVSAAILLGLPVLAWAIPTEVASQLNAAHDTAFVGRTPSELSIALQVDRTTQKRAIAKHGSQSTDNPVLWKRLELLGDTEWLRWLRPPVPSPIEFAGGE